MSFIRKPYATKIRNVFHIIQESKTVLLRRELDNSRRLLCIQTCNAAVMVYLAKKTAIQVCYTRGMTDCYTGMLYSRHDRRLHKCAILQA